MIELASVNVWQEGETMDEIETERLRLRRFMPADLDAVRRIYGDSEVMRYMWDGRARTEEQIRDALAFLMDSWERRGFGMWAVVHKEQDEVILFRSKFCASWAWCLRGTHTTTARSRCATRLAATSTGWPMIRTV